MADFNEVKSLIEEQNRAWEEFKRTNDAILAGKAEGKSVSDLQVKLDKISADLDAKSADLVEVQKRLNRQMLAGGGDGKGLTPEQAEHKAALQVYLRKGGHGDLEALERKAMSSGSDPDGGYLIDAEMDGAIDRIASTASMMRQLATVRSIGAASYEKLVKTRGISGGWLAESADSAESTETQWSKIEIPAFKMYAEPWVPNELLEDAGYDLEGDIVSESGIVLGETEGAAFITGNGVGKPRGIAAYTFVANSSFAWGKVGYIVSGKSAAFASAAPADKVVALQHALKPAYRANATWLTNDATLGTMRQLKDGSGSYYLWQPDPAAGFGGRFLGSPVAIDDNVADIGAGSYSLFYGDFRRAYTIVDRRGRAIIRDNVTKKGVTKFHVSQRVGGGITHFEAIKGMKFATS